MKNCSPSKENQPTIFTSIVFSNEVSCFMAICVVSICEFFKVSYLFYLGMIILT